MTEPEKVIAMFTDRHALMRTSPHGAPFIGQCWKCGCTGLRLDQLNDLCPKGLTYVPNPDDEPLRV